MPILVGVRIDPNFRNRQSSYPMKKTANRSPGPDVTGVASIEVRMIASAPIDEKGDLDGGARAFSSRRVRWLAGSAARGVRDGSSGDRALVPSVRAVGSACPGDLGRRARGRLRLRQRRIHERASPG